MSKTVITPEKIIEINELYLKLGTYAAVSRALNGSPAPSTVKKYIIPNYVSRKDITKKIFHIDELPVFSMDDFKELKESDNWGDFCILSEEENTEIEDLWKELEV